MERAGVTQAINAPVGSHPRAQTSNNRHLVSAKLPLGFVFIDNVLVGQVQVNLGRRQPVVPEDFL